MITGNWILHYWYCTARPERDAAWYFSLLWSSGTTWVLAETVELIFTVALGTAADARFAAFKANWAIAYDEIEVEGVLLRFYAADSSWLIPLTDARIAGDLTLEGDPCPEVVGFGHPA